MALIEEAVVALLIADATIAELIATRVYPLNVPEGTAMPAIAYQAISGVPDYSHDGFDGLTQTFIQLTIEADTYAEAKALAQACRAALGGYAGTIASVTIGAAFMSADIDGYNETELAPVVRLEAELWHNAA